MSDEKPSLLRHPRVRRVLGLLAVALSALGTVWFFAFRPYVSTEDARVAAPMIVAAPQGAGGRVERVLVAEGQLVGVGDPLVELDAAAERALAERARALVALADARVGEAEAQLQLERRAAESAEHRAKAGIRMAQASFQRTVKGARVEEIARARADVATAAAAAAQSRRDLDRAEALGREGAIPTATLESARTADVAARSTLDARTAALALVEHGNRPEDVSVSEGGLLQAQAGLDEALGGDDRVLWRTKQLDEARAQAQQARAEQSLSELALRRMTLTSAVAGTVVRVGVDVGDFLSPTQGAVTLVDLSQAWIAANIEETAVERLRIGQSVHISLDAGGSLEGVVETVTRAAASQYALIPAENAAGNFTKVVQRIPIRIALAAGSPTQALRVGQSAVVRIDAR